MKLIHIQIAEHINHKAHVVMHFTYLVLVFTESHGLYGYAAGGMATIMLVGAGINKKIKKLTEKNDV